MRGPDFVPTRTPPAPPAHDVDWPELLTIAARIGVQVYRADHTGQLQPITTTPTADT